MLLYKAYHENKIFSTAIYIYCNIYIVSIYQSGAAQIFIQIPPDIGTQQLRGLPANHRIHIFCEGDWHRWVKEKVPAESHFELHHPIVANITVRRSPNS